MLFRSVRSRRRNSKTMFRRPFRTSSQPPRLSATYRPAYSSLHRLCNMQLKNCLPTKFTCFYTSCQRSFSPEPPPTPPSALYIPHKTPSKNFPPNWIEPRWQKCYHMWCAPYPRRGTGGCQRGFPPPAARGLCPLDSHQGGRRLPGPWQIGFLLGDWLFFWILHSLVAGW